ncbi:MAG: hypothetical protein K5695_08070 [Oscillospiraceae bacterium]|nr:hypothetical protein [Oscillospiraceae bacterium]
MKKYAKDNNFLVLQVFREEGKSGKYKENRPKYLEMLRYISLSSRHKKATKYRQKQ